MRKTKDGCDSVQKLKQLICRSTILNQKIQEKSPNFNDLIHPRPLSVLEARGLFGAGEAGLLWVPGEFGTHVVVVGSDGVRWHRSSMTADEVADVERLRALPELSETTFELVAMANALLPSEEARGAAVRRQEDATEEKVKGAADLSQARVLAFATHGLLAGEEGVAEPGLSGLARAFLYAGAKSLLASHWPVLDKVAPKISVQTLKPTRKVKDGGI